VRTRSLPTWLVALGPLTGAILGLADCDSPPPLPHGGAGAAGNGEGGTACIECHQEDYDATENPVHPGLMPTTCNDCHDTTAWRPARYPHTGFPLEGAHVRSGCTSCHGAPADYNEPLPTECVGCHREDYDASPYPGHQGFPTTCQDCHSQDAWVPALATGDHSWFPLDGAHGRATCIACHGDPPQYGGQPTECVGCHRPDYDASPFPGHDGFPTTCADCHGVEAWVPATFEHDAYPLEGAHAVARCLSCHGDPPDYENLPTDCLGCHRAERDASPILHDGFSTTCTDCHSMAAWTPAAFDHDTYPLLGAHTEASCVSCHGDPPVFEGTSRECLGCHRDERDASPIQHDGFSTTCTDCHSMAAWTPAAFDHDTYPLRGAHAAATCVSCHGDPPTYAGTSRECLGCHRADRDQAAMPHDGFSTTCTDCHSLDAWQPAEFEHTGYPLDGAHAGATCASCHGDPPVYQGIGNQCVDCHRVDYNGSPYPGHDQFPLTCSDCHSTNGWVPAFGGTHPQDRFPLPHHGSECNECHDTNRSPSYMDNVTCIDCHEHSQQNADPDHREVNDYQWDANRPDFCRDCHADGRNR